MTNLACAALAPLVLCLLVPGCMVHDGVDAGSEPPGFLPQEGSPYMRPASRDAMVPRPGDATVVFLRPHQRWNDRVGYLILDSDRHFLGDLRDASRFEVSVPAGEHFFVGAPDGAYVHGSVRAFPRDTMPSSGLRTVLEPGRRYFVAVEWARDFPRDRTYNVKLVPIAPRVPALWGKLPQLLDGTEPFASDFEAGQAHVDAVPTMFEALVQGGVHRWERLHRDGRAEEYSLLPDDGV